MKQRLKLQAHRPIRKRVAAGRTNRLLQQWEKFVGVTSISEGSRLLGVTWRTYANYRKLAELDQITRLAMAAIAAGAKPYGNE